VSDIFTFMSDTFMFMSFTYLSSSAINADPPHRSAIDFNAQVQVLSIPIHLIRVLLILIRLCPMVLIKATKVHNCNGDHRSSHSLRYEEFAALIALNSDTFMFMSTL
jgi:hypothetical protein